MHSAAEVFVLLEERLILLKPALVMYQRTLRCASASHLDEHRAGLGGDGRQLLQEALCKAQVLFQALILC